MVESYIKLRQAKNLNEFFSILPYKTIEWLCAAPVILFLISPVIYIMRNLFHFWTYEIVIEDINYVSLILMIVVIILYIGKCASKGKVLDETQKYNLSFFIFLSYVSLMIISTIINSIQSTPKQSNRGEGLATYISYILIYYLCASLIESKFLKLLIMRIFVISGVIMGGLSIIDLYFVHIPMYNHFLHSNISAVFLHFNHYGYYLTLILLVSAGIAAFDKNLPFRILGWFSFVINTIALIRDDTFGCYLAVAFGLVFAQIVHFILHKRTNKAIWCVLGTYIGISFVLSFWYHTVFRNFLTLFFDLGKIISEEDAEHAGSSRWGLWTQSLQFIAERPLTGWGVEGKADELVGCTRPHNEYLQQMLFFGIPAGLLYIWGILEVYLHGLRNKLHLDAPTLVALIAAFGYIVSAFFGNTTYYVSPMFFCILGLGYRVAGK